MCRDALKLINATICGMATTDFWKVMESFFGVDKDADEAALDEAQSLAKVLKLQKQDSQESVPTIMKETAEEEIVVDDDDESEVASVRLALSTASSLKTLTEKKKMTQDKYPSYCTLKEAQLFYPTDEKTMHTTGVNPSFISSRQKMGEYKGYYRCAYNQKCEYAAHTKAVVASHIHRVHLGIALGCRFCPSSAWWQGRYWSDHMDHFHSDQVKYEPLVMPEGELKAVPVEGDHFITEESFPFLMTGPPVPIHRTEPKCEPEEEDEDESEKPPKSGKFEGADLEYVMDNV